MGSAERGDGEPQRERIEGVRVLYPHPSLDGTDGKIGTCGEALVPLVRRYPRPLCVHRDETHRTVRYGGEGLPGDGRSTRGGRR